MFKENTRSQYSSSTSSTFGTSRPSDRPNIHYPYSNSNQIDSPSTQRPVQRPQLAREQKLRCTWHCFCISSKTLSVGLFLVVTGSLMSAFGFIHQSEFLGQNTNVTAFSADQNATMAKYRNLCYAGPVILGLGAIVLLASLILLCETRDTLGIKIKPVQHG